MGDVPQSPRRARAGSTSSAGGGSQTDPSSPFAHLVHRTSYIDLKALASPNDEEEDRHTDWSTYVDDSPTQRRNKISPGSLSSQFISPAEEEALRSGKRWARPGSDVVPPLLPHLFDTEGQGNDGDGSSGSESRRTPGSLSYGEPNGNDMGLNGDRTSSTSRSILSAFSNGSSTGGSGPDGNKAPSSVHSYRSNGGEKAMPGSKSHRTSNSVRSVLSNASDDNSAATPLRSGSQIRFKCQRTTEPNESSNNGHGREIIKFLPDETNTEGTDDSGRSVVGDLEAADIPLEHVNMSYFRSRDAHMADDFEQKKKRKIGMCCILVFVLLALIGLIIGLAISEHQKRQNDNGSTNVAGAIGPASGAAVVVPDSGPSSVPSTAPVMLSPSPEPENSDSVVDSPTLTSPTMPPSPSPTHGPTNPPSPGDTMDWLLALLMKHSPYPERLIARGRNAQKRAYSWLAEDPKIRKYSERRIIQRWVLATAFFSQKDPWLWKDWKNHPNECFWIGIQCRFMNNAEDSGGGWVVTGISVAHAFLEGVIPEEISLLEHLTELNLHGNSFGLAQGFQGTIPTELGKLKHLEYLNLSYNSFEGTVPTELAGLPKLVDLRLARNSLEGSMPEELCHRGNMCYLSADCEEVECDYGCCTRCCKDGGLCCYKNGFCFF